MEVSVFVSRKSIQYNALFALPPFEQSGAADGVGTVAAYHADDAVVAEMPKTLPQFTPRHQNIDGIKIPHCNGPHRAGAVLLFRITVVQHDFAFIANGIAQQRGNVV